MMLNKLLSTQSPAVYQDSQGVPVETFGAAIVEPFSYPDGALNGLGGWGSSNFTVVSGQLKVATTSRFASKTLAAFSAGDWSLELDIKRTTASDDICSIALYMGDVNVLAASLQFSWESGAGAAGKISEVYIAATGETTDEVADDVTYVTGTTARMKFQYTASTHTLAAYLGATLLGTKVVDLSSLTGIVSISADVFDATDALYLDNLLITNAAYLDRSVPCALQHLSGRESQAFQRNGLDVDYELFTKAALTAKLNDIAIVDNKTFVLKDVNDDMGGRNRWFCHRAKQLRGV